MPTRWTRACTAASTSAAVAKRERSWAGASPTSSSRRSCSRSDVLRDQRDKEATMITQRIARLVLAIVVAACAGIAGAADTAYVTNLVAGSRQVLTFPVGAPGTMTSLGAQPDLFAGLDFNP